MTVRQRVSKSSFLGPLDRFCDLLEHIDVAIDQARTLELGMRSGKAGLPRQAQHQLPHSIRRLKHTRQRIRIKESQPAHLPPETGSATAGSSSSPNQYLDTILHRRKTFPRGKDGIEYLTSKSKTYQPLKDPFKNIPSLCYLSPPILSLRTCIVIITQVT